MWVRKWERDRQLGVESPIPTQVVSNEEFVPRPQTAQQRQWERLIGELAAEKAKRLGMDRRSFLRSSMGMATAFLASNMVYGAHWDVDAAETMEPTATDEKFPRGEFFVFDVQTHFTNGVPLGFRNAEFIRNMGFDLRNDPDAYSFHNFVKEIFYDSETSMIVISGVPGRERQRDDRGKVLEGEARGGGLLPSWLMSEKAALLNDLAGTRRAFCQGNVAPNHYWDHASGRADQPALFEQMEREVGQYGIASWKWYCHTDPGRSGNGFRLDDERLTYPFYEKSRQLGLRRFSVHKGYASQSHLLGHLAEPSDVAKAALDHPDLTFIIYHSALRHDPAEPGFRTPGFYDPVTGDFEWHAALMDVKRRHPEIQNVYPEIGSAFGSLAIQHPEMCMHLMGKNIQHYGADHVIWGTDCLWWGSPQWVIDAFKRFQISDEFCERFGYAKLTRDDKARIFGLNAAQLYGVDAPAAMQAIPADRLSARRTSYLASGGQRDNRAYGWVQD
jgi:uncharacterized protein